MLKQVFEDLLKDFKHDSKLIEKLWKEIEKAYGERGRHYHNLLHLENLYHELNEVKRSVRQWEVMMMSLFYHDIVYNTLRQDNEEKSAMLAQKRLQSLNVPVDKIELCYSQILATKGHTVSPDADTNLFTDADLSILGKDESAYQTYAGLIRKEYSIYPSLIYNPGRKKVLNHFLAMERIFKTDHFHVRYELQARKNLATELQSLS
jgi:predicted metal-dependent HD superfamily phosphohydrolase